MNRADLIGTLYGNGRVKATCDAGSLFLPWVRANDIVAMQGDDGAWTRRDPA